MSASRPPFPPPPGLFPLTVHVLLVTYDLKTPMKSYTPFYEALKRQGSWWHYLSSTWLVATTKTPQEVYSALAPHLTVRDFILITRITKPLWGFLPKDAWNWINQHVPG
jgi:hypothetical protein